MKTSKQNVRLAIPVYQACLFFPPKNMTFWPLHLLLLG